MSGALLSFGILNPWGFILALPVLGALVYAYLRKQKLVSVVIPTLFLLRDLAQPVSTRKKFAPPPRFWFELFLLSLLLLCLVGVFHKTKTERYAVLIDNSLSTAAVSGEGLVMDQLKAEAEGAVRELPGDAVFDLYRTSPQIERVGAADLERAELIEALKIVSPAYAAESLSDNIPQVLQRGQYNRLIVISDRELEFDPSAVEMRKVISLHSLKSLSPGQLQNVSLSDISFERDPQGDSQGTLRFSAVAYTRDAVKLPVVIERLDYSDTAQPWKELNRQSVSLSPAQTQTVTYQLTTDKIEGVRVRINADALPVGSDALKEDNQLYLSLKRENRLVYVVSIRSLRDLGIEKIRGIKFKALSEDEFQQAIRQEDTATFLLVDFIPKGLPDKNLIIVSPPNGTAGFEVGKVVQGAELTEWKSGHPLLTYIDTATIRLSRFVPMVPPLWGESVISTSRGAALMAGERGTRRTVVVGFDLFPYRGRVSPTISVLFLNMLRWVSADPLGGRSVDPYEPLNLINEATRVLSVTDTVVSAPLPAPEKRVPFIPSQPGMYLGLDGDATLSASAVNFIAAHESDLRSRHEALAAATIPPVPDKLERQSSLSDYLIPLLLAIILIDMFYLLYRAGLRRRSTSSPFRRRAAA